MKKFIKSFAYAIHGIIDGFQERNFKIHWAVTAAVLAGAVWFKISVNEWMVVLILIGGVMMAELFNTAMEKICDLLNNKLQLKFSQTTIIRDLGAGAVLIMALIAALVGLMIFGSRIWLRFGVGV